MNRDDLESTGQGGREMSKKTGYLIANKFKTKPDHPDLWGKITIGGSEYAISGWHCHTKDEGVPYISLAVRLFKKKSIQEQMDETNTGHEPD